MLDNEMYEEEFQEQGYSEDSSSFEESINEDSDEALVSEIQIDKGSFVITMATVSVSDIVIPTPIKDSRKETYLGLSRSVEELGVLVPIQIMVLEGYAEYVEENGSEEGYDGPKYLLLDGLRRIFALKKNGLDRVNAVIYDFKDKDKGSDMVNILSLILNKVQKKSWSEVWYLYQVLESQSALSPGNIEYLLQLEPGDAMKLKEIMTRKNEFPEPAEDLLSKKKTLQQAYNQLNKLMKEQNLLAKEDVSGVSEMEETEGVVQEGTDDKLSDDEVKEILDMESSFDGDLSEDDFDELMGNNLPDDRQTVGERHPLDPALRAAVLQRDGYCCRITGRGKGLPAPIALGILNVHHKIPVHCGGTDSMDNLITVCLDAHTLIHIIERNQGKLGMSKEQYDALDEEEQRFITGVMKIARIAVEANKRMGRSREQIRKDTADSIRFKMPGTAQKENMEAVAKAKVEE
jgi:5-methylcytosine-specific restriction protein A